MTNFERTILILIVIITFSSCGIFNKGTGRVVSNKDIKAEKKELNYQYSFFEANKLKMLGNYNEAASYYLHCLKLKPESGAAAYELAGMAVAKKDLSSAIKFAEVAYKSNTSNKWYLIMLADITKRQGNLNRTIELLKKLSNDYPQVSEYYLEIASTYMAMNKPNQAIKIFDEVEKKFGVSELISYEKERIFEIKGDYINARKELKKLIKTNPQESKYYGLLAESYMSTGQLDKAKETFDLLLEFDPDNGIAFLSMSEYYRIKNNTQETEIYIKKAFISNDIDVVTKIQILVGNYAYKKDGIIDKIAFELLDSLEKKYPNDSRIYAVYSDFLIKEKNFDKSLIYLKKVLNIDKSNTKVWEQLFIIESKQNQLDSMYVHSKQAIELFPNFAKFYMYNAVAEYELKRYTECIKTSKSGLNYTFDNDYLKIQFYTYLAQSYYEIRKHKESDAEFEKILKLDPDNDITLNNYSYYLALRKEKLDLALKMSEKLYRRNPSKYWYIDTYAWVLFNRNNYVKAEVLLKESIDKGGNQDAAILEHYGDALFKNNKINEAVKVWKQAKQLTENTSKLEKKISEKKL